MYQVQISSLGTSPDILLVGGSIKGAMKAVNASSNEKAHTKVDAT